MSKRRWISMAAGIFVIAVILAATLLGCGGGDNKNDLEITSDNSQMHQPNEQDVEEARVASQGSSGYLTANLDSGQSGNAFTLPQLQLMVIKTALMKMETAEGDYAKIREDAVAVASSVGGYVESESASRGGEGLTYATLTLRIPSESFDKVVSEVSAMGKVISTQVSTNDVSGEYVDLEGRLRHLQAEESFYMTLIDQARTIQEMITIRGHLDSIQLQREQAQGRINFLNQQIGYSTLTLSVDETSNKEEDKGFLHSMGEAFKSFGRGMGKLAVGFFYALPYLAILAILAGAAWLIVRRTRRGKPTSGEL